MATTNPTIKMNDGRTVKVAMHSIFAYVTTNHAQLLEDPNFAKLLVASKGGFSGEDSFITIDDVKVARVCAMTGAIFAHDNTDKEASFFYKNGSYMIGAEVVKANARKAWDLDRNEREEALEADMLEGTIKPKEWKQLANAIKSEEFTFELSDEDKKSLISTFNGYDTKQSFTEAYEADEVIPFSDYADEIKALRDLAPKREADEA